jgi:hypothetical protein
MSLPFWCLGNQNNFVNLAGVTALRTLIINAGGQVTLTDMRQSSALLTNITSTNGAASVSYASSYVGKYSLTSRTGLASTTGGPCQAGGASATSGGPSTTSGSCQGDIYTDPALNIDAYGAVDVNLGVPVCQAGWLGDPVGEFVAPASPPMSPNRPAESQQLYGSDLWTVFNDWSYLQTETNLATGFMATMVAYMPQYQFLTSSSNLPLLRGGISHSFSMNFGATKLWGNTPQLGSMTAFIVANPTWEPDWKMNETIFDNQITPSVIHSGTPVTSGFTSGTDMPFNFVFTPSADTTNARLIVRIYFSGALGNSSWALSFKDIQLTRQATAWTTPATVSGASEKVTIPKMPAPLDTNPRTTAECPHLRSGLKHWHDPATWSNNQVPTPSSVITLPANTSVLISSCSLDRSATYQKIIVPATSQLIFADSPISLKVRSIFVEGKMFIGAPGCRIHAPITITFTGAKSLSDDIATGFGTKGVGVAGSGSIDIHGYQFHPTWTRVSATIKPGDNRVYLQDAVNWAVGQSLVVATSIYHDYEEDQNEVVQIVSISDDGKVLEVSPAFKFLHYGGSEYQSEVGLLSRRIILQGDSMSDAENFGGHVMVMGQGRFSGVQFTKMGQQNMLARYPVHWHLIGSSPSSYATDNSFWNGFYRCISIHATHDTTVLRNVAYNTVGHCYYLEEGVEENNTLSYNLAVHIRCLGPPMEGGGQRGQVFQEDSTALLPADRAAAGFYITNAYNTITGNAASGGWAGFSFPNLPTPLGFNKDRPFSPQRRVSKLFDGNTAHSSGYHFSGDGGCIYIGGKLWYENGVLWYDNGRYERGTSANTLPGTANYIDPLWMSFTNTKAWLCQIGLSHWGERADVNHYEVHDSARSVQLFGESWYGNALVNAKSGNPNGFPNEQTQMGFQFYDTWVKTMVTNVVFRNFVPRPASDPSWYGKRTVLTSLNFSDKFKPQGISATARVTYENVPPEIRIGHTLVNSGSARYFNFVDWDGTRLENFNLQVPFFLMRLFTGSFVGANGPRFVGSAHEGDWWNFDSGCEKRTEWNVWLCPKTGTREIGNLEIYVPIQVAGPGGVMYDFITDWGNGPSDGYPANDDWKIGNMSLFGPGIPAGRKTAITRNPGVTGVTNIGWYMYLQGGTPRTMKIQTYVIPRGGYIMFAVRYPQSCTFDITVRHAWIGANDLWKTVTSASNFNEVLNSDGLKYYWDSANQFLFLKLRIFDSPYAQAGDQNPSFDGFTRDGVTIYSISQPQSYLINANCGAGNFYSVNDVHPTNYWV